MSDSLQGHPMLTGTLDSEVEKKKIYNLPDNIQKCNLFSSMNNKL